MMRRGRAVKHLVKRLLPVVERRMQNKHIQGSKPVLETDRVDVPSLIAVDGYPPMDDRLVTTVRSLVGNEDCTGHPRPLVWVYPSACHGESSLLVKCVLSLLTIIRRQLYTRCTISAGIRSTWMRCGKRLHNIRRRTQPATIMNTCPYLTVFSKSQQDSVLPILVCPLLSSSPDPNHCPTPSHCDSQHKSICPPYSYLIH